MACAAISLSRIAWKARPWTLAIRLRASTKSTIVTITTATWKPGA
jgi:hypothetical protein